MGLRLTIRSLLWGVCLAVALCGARTAHAAAPMCDETASSRIAPPPVLPIRDVKLEVGNPCDFSPLSDAPVTVAPVGARPQESSTVSFNAAPIEAWVRPNDVRITAPALRRSAVDAGTFLLPKPGFSPGVFRPPR